MTVTQGQKCGGARKASGKGVSDGTLKILFIIYIVLLLKVIVFKLPWTQMKEIMDSWSRDVIWEGMDSANFVPFRTIKMYLKYWGRGIRSFENLIGNIVVFVPFGYFLPRLYQSARKILVFICYVLLIVLCIEFFQLFSAFGSFDVDDIILNCGGALLGYIGYAGVYFFKSSKLFGDESSLIK